MQLHRRSLFQTGALVFALAGGFVIQAAPLTCTTNTGALPIARVEGLTEPVADYILVCTGGTPTPAGNVVPQVNITLFLNTHATSHITANISQSYFNEALILVDEPNSLNSDPQHPLLNCGNTGAPDNGPSGPGVCSILSTGDPTQTYDGTACPTVGITYIPPPVYGCGRPNAFQGRLGTTGLPTQDNVISFLGVPLDPPGAGIRILRITNLRGNAYLLGGGQINATINIQGASAIGLFSPTRTLSFNLPGLVATVPAAGKIKVTEGFASSFKDRNVAFTVGNTVQPLAGNASGPPWIYVPPSFNYPDQVAQNVPGTLYNTEDMFQWQSAAVNAPPTPTNPPPGIGIGPVANIGNSLVSGIYGPDTGIDVAGVASQGTRIALQFTGVPNGLLVQCQTKIPLFKVSASGPASGVLSMTTTDAAGAGAYTPVGGVLGSSYPDLAVFEVLYADPFAIEMATIPCYLVSPPTTVAPTITPQIVSVSPEFAPFYTSASASRPTPTTADPTPTALPRFGDHVNPIQVTLGPYVPIIFPPN